MLKKIKDLTEEEIKKICEERERCADCPLMLYKNANICLLDMEIKEKLEKEIELK